MAALLAGVIALGPARSQDRPESILPPGFDEPVAPAPTPTPRATGVTAPQPGLPALPGAPVTANGALPLPLPSPTPSGTPTPALSAAEIAQYEMPDFARRSLTLVGVAGPSDGLLSANALGRADGRWLEALMRDIDTPIASRWLSIALRRTLLSRLDTPPHVNGADFAAERANLLLKMGEAAAARGIVQSVDTDNYTPKLLQIAMQSALANGDPGELCGLTDYAATVSTERGWVLARAMCAGLGGQPAAAQAQIKAARRGNVAGGIDLLLAEKVAGAGASGRQAVTIEWDGVDQLTAWRYGLAMASAVAIPDTLMDTVRPNVRYWLALSPTVSARARAAAAEAAAVRGVFSNAGLVDLYSSIDQDDDQALAELGIARDLASAYNAPTAVERQTALTQLWDEPKTADGHFARMILTARAAARVPTDTDGADAARLIASMLSAGMDRTAQRWRDKVGSGSDAWAMLVLADPDTHQRQTYSDVASYSPSGDSATRKRQMLFAGLAGLGRLSQADIERGAQSLDVKIGADNAWTSAIDRAAREHAPATVVILAAIGMQTPLWQGVPPETLYRIVTALRATGMEGEARMIAAEAIARL